MSQEAECADVCDASDGISCDVSGKKDTKILALYLMQVTLLGGTILLYSFIYPKVSRLVVNNMCMLLSIGFIMITRLNYDKAAKQYLIAAAGIVLCLVIPIIIRKARFLSEWRILYGIIGIVSLAVVVVVGKVSYGAMLALQLPESTSSHQNL